MSLVREITDIMAKRFARQFFTGDCTCRIYDDETPSNIVHIGVCYASRRRVVSTPKTDPTGRDITRLVNVKLPLNVPLIKEGYRVELLTGVSEELKKANLVVKDASYNSEYQYCKNLICEASTEFE